MLFDNQYNLLYCIVQPKEEEDEESKSSVSSKLFGSGKKGKVPARSNNVVVWDVPKQLKIVLFTESMLEAGERVQSIFMEHRIDTEAQRIVYTDQHRIINNHLPTPFTEPNNRVLITTYVPDMRKYCLWSCSKFGDNLQRLRFLSPTCDWHLDELGQTLRFVEWGDNDAEIHELPWRL